MQNFEVLQIKRYTVPGLCWDTARIFWGQPNNGMKCLQQSLLHLGLWYFSLWAVYMYFEIKNTGNFGKHGEFCVDRSVATLIFFVYGLI